ncbi:0949d246-e6e0-417a-8ad7-1b425005253b [Thermothielavioides terrestris]
MVVKD